MKELLDEMESALRGAEGFEADDYIAGHRDSTRHWAHRLRAAIIEAEIISSPLTKTLD